MVQGIEASGAISPQEMHQKVMLQQMLSYDKDGKVGLSKNELANYISDKEISNSEVPEFATKLMEKFNEVDADKNGILSDSEMNSLVSNRGMWYVNPAFSLEQASSQSQNSTGILSGNIQNLINKGGNYLNNSSQFKSQVENILNKFV